MEYIDGEQNLDPEMLAMIKKQQFQQGGNFDSEKDDLTNILDAKKAGLLTEEQAKGEIQALSARRILR